MGVIVNLNGGTGETLNAVLEVDLRSIDRNPEICKSYRMKTTLDIDDELYRRVKAKAALEGRKVTELVEEGLREILHQTPPSRRRAKRVKLPLMRAKPGQKKLFHGMTSEQIHQHLADLETVTDLESHEASVRR